MLNMIRIEVSYVDGKIRELSVEGHSNFAKLGKDIVCAGVSSIVIGGANAISQPECYTFKEKDGYFLIHEIATTSESDYQTLKVMVIQLKTIAEAYPDNVTIIEKGN